MRKILIIEDEQIAAQHLERMLAEVLQEPLDITVLQTVEESVEYLQQCPPWPAVIFTDIHLADGLAFRIFEQMEPQCPVIFTTAYDQYALDAFRAGGYDYLLKPIDPDSLERAIRKCGMRNAESEEREEESATHYPLPTTHTQLPTLPRYRSHFLIPVRDKLIPLEVKQIACFYVDEKITRALLFDGHEQIIDRPLEAIMEQLDPARFFRANRQYIVAHDAIREIGFWPVSKLVLTLTVDTPERIIISKARVAEFKHWYTT